MRKLVLPLAGVVAVVVAVPAAGEDRLRAGTWRMEMRGAAGPLGGRPMVTTRCIGADEARKANGSVAEIRASLEATSPGCRIGAVSAEGERVVFDQICGEIRQRVEFAYRGDTMSGRTVMNHPGRPDEVVEFVGRRIGTCP